MAIPLAREVLATPLTSDADVLDRIDAIISAEARRQRTLWLFFLDGAGLQSGVIVPIDGIPEFPDPDLIGNVCSVVAQVLADTAADGSVVITLTRAGAADLGDNDSRWLSGLRRGMAAHLVPVRMLGLATPSGVREYGPAAVG
ncbi:MAG TPA: hypothetical protein VG164_10170 [Trebonia sp.]|jgi:hypothetical protein|nr:hypothetical protein [Trebonia sp.]